MTVSGKDRVETYLVCTRDWREFEFGTLISTRSLTEDEGNYYLHDHNDEFPAGYQSNYLTLPKHSWSVTR